MTTLSTRAIPNPDEIVIPDPGFNVILYKGECYSRTKDKAPIDTITGYPYTGWDGCVECITVNPTPTPTPTYTLPPPAVCGFALNISSHVEGNIIDIEVHRLSGFGIEFDAVFTVTALSATAGIDYRVITPPVLKFGEFDNVKYIRVELLNDWDMNELDELIHLNLVQAMAKKPRERATVLLGQALRIVQITESGIPPPTIINSGDIFTLDKTILNAKMTMAPGQDATARFYPNSALFPALFYDLTVKNIAGNFVWDDSDVLGSRHEYTTFPETHRFSVNLPDGSVEWFDIIYAGPGSFIIHAMFNAEPPPPPTPTPTPTPT